MRAVDERYDAGYCAGYLAGGKDALRSMTHLTTMLNEPRTLEALRTLLRVLGEEDDDEAASPYWRSDA
jgi:hypothetical protein